MLRFSEVLVDECYTDGWYEVCVVGYAHSAELVEHVGIVEPYAECLGAYPVFVGEFALCFGFDNHISGVVTV